jgi:hypothetical protein
MHDYIFVVVFIFFCIWRAFYLKLWVLEWVIHVALPILGLGMLQHGIRENFVDLLVMGRLQYGNETKLGGLVCYNFFPS